VFTASKAEDPRPGAAPSRGRNPSALHPREGVSSDSLSRAREIEGSVAEDLVRKMHSLARKMYCSTRRGRDDAQERGGQTERGKGEGGERERERKRETRTLVRM